MAINQLSTANTFQQWLIATQSLIENFNFFEDTANTITVVTQAAFDTANISFDTANAAFDAANTALSESSNTANLIYEISDDTTSNTSLFVALFDANTGIPNAAYVSSTKLYYNPSNGQLSATNFDSLSDLNKKTDIETIQNAIEKVGELRGVTFKWKENGHKSMGLIAQEIEQVIPEVVVTNQYGEKSVTYGSLIGLLVESIKELDEQVKEIKNHLNKL